MRDIFCKISACLVLLQSKAKLQFEKIRQMIDGKPYQQHVVQQFYAVDGNSNDTQVNYSFR